MTAEPREPHPLSGMVGDVEGQKKRLSAVSTKATSDLLSEVRKEHNNTVKRLSHVSTKNTATLLSEVRKDHETALKKHVAPVAKQDLLSAVRTEGGAAKKRLSHIEPKINNQVLMAEE